MADSYSHWVDFTGLDHPIHQELQALALRHGMVMEAGGKDPDGNDDDDDDDEAIGWRNTKRWRNKLEHRHAAVEFTPTESVGTETSLLLSSSSPLPSTQDLFYRFARAVCRVGRIPRKEFFETWAMAVYVHRSFPDAQRIADLASGHGLLSWALLALADHRLGQHAVSNGEQEKRDLLPPLSVVCIDRQRPKAVDLIRAVMLEEWPQFQSCWDFVQGPIEAVIVDPSTVLVGIHACSTVSDQILAQAIQGRAPLALVPCCHSKKCLKGQHPHQYARAKKDGVATVQDLPEGLMQLANFIDSLRISRLEAAGFHVQEAKIPRVFTPKNRIILARPLTIEGGDVDSTNSSVPSFKTKDGRSALLFSSSGGDDGILIPVANDPRALETIRQLAARRQ